MIQLSFLKKWTQKDALINQLNHWATGLKGNCSVTSVSDNIFQAESDFILILLAFLKLGIDFSFYAYKQAQARIEIPINISYLTRPC